MQDLFQHLEIWLVFERKHFLSLEYQMGERNENERAYKTLVKLGIYTKPIILMGQGPFKE